jgi:hypothetical protein
MNKKQYDKHFRQVIGHNRFPWSKLIENAKGGKMDYDDDEKTLLVLAENMRAVLGLFEHLSDAKLYIHFKPTPSVQKHIPYSRYLNYHLHGYLNNVYMLSERMTSFLARIKKSAKDERMKKDIDKFTQIVVDNFETLNDIRNRHVHTTRYIDEDICRLEEFEYAYNGSAFIGSKIIQKKHVSMAHSEVKKNWMLFISTSNQLLRALILLYFNFLIDLFINNDKSLKIHLNKYSYEVQRSGKGVRSIH